MTVLVTGVVETGLGRKDSRAWKAWSPVYREGPNGEVITTRDDYPVRVVGGTFSAQMQPGVAVIENPDGKRYTVTVLDEDCDLWELIATAVAFPPDTSAEALASAVTTYLEENPVTSVIAEGISDSGAAGRAAVQADTDADLRSAAGASTVGAQVFTAADAAAGRDALGALGSSDIAPAVVIASGVVASLQSEITATPDGSTLRIPAGTYALTSTLSVVDKSITLDLTGVKFTRATAGVVLAASATAGTIHDVASLTPTTITEENAMPGLVIALSSSGVNAGWARGDIVRLVADDLIPGGRPGTGGNQRRTGQVFTVESVDDGEITVYGSLYDPMTTNIRVYRMKSEHKVRVIGGDVDAEGSGSGVVTFTNLVAPEIVGADMKSATGPGVAFFGCVDHVAEVKMRYGPNDPGSSLLGYGVLEVSSSRGRIRVEMLRGRHAQTAGANEVAADSASVWLYGRSYAGRVTGSAVDTASSAWGTHPESAEYVFSDITGDHCFGGIGLRGRNHDVRGASFREVNRAVWVFSHTAGGVDAESWGHDIRDVVVNGCTSASIGAIMFDINPTSGTMETRPTRLRNITIDNHAFSVVYAENCVVEVDGIKTVVGATLPDYTGMIDARNARVVGSDFRVDLRQNTSGIGLVYAVFPASDTTSEVRLSGDNEWLFTSGQTSRIAALVRRNDATEVLQIAGLALEEVPSTKVSGSSPANALYSADSYIEWRSRKVANGAIQYLSGTTIIPSGGVIQDYNTADQVTNYERVRGYWNSDVFTLISEKGGTGTVRHMQFAALGILQIYGSVQTGGSVQMRASTSSASATIAGVSGTLSSSSGVQNALLVNPTFNQSGTGGYVALLVNVTETATGSGAKKLLDLAVGSASKHSVDNTGAVFMANVASPPATPTGGGVLYVEAGALKFKGSGGTVTTLGAA